MNDIQVGKFYRTRNGLKVRIYALDGCAPYVVHGAYQHKELGWIFTGWTDNGMYNSLLDDHPTSDLDIVSEWVDKPVFDWSIQSPWFKYAAMDYDGQWFLFDNKPTRVLDHWTGVGSTCVARIPLAYVPFFLGDWKDSLIQRP
jgi:hypothetical protein